MDFLCFYSYIAHCFKTEMCYYFPLCSRLELGLPIEEPGKYVDDSFWGKNRYDPRKARCRSDYWGDPKDLKSDSKKKTVSRDRGMPKKEVMRDGMQDAFAKGSGTTATENKPLVNGTESLIMGNVQGMFDQV
jgi:hypothetical protein